MAVYGVAVILGEEKLEVLTALSQLEPVSGRLELIRSQSGKTGIVDYAHTPDALKNILSAINKIRPAGIELITVVGAGGDRDKEKRPIMAKISVESSDKVILTSDNPRSENPEDIINEMMTGIGPENRKKVLKIIDRKEAIRTAIMLAGKEDIILVAGKGHEDYQEIKGKRYPFDDRVELRKTFQLETQQN
jgi:UDP-N-acetylmuramoyl-L-alanyl-D-glutamate--2,6-diaminopimelate ligase